MEKYPSQRTSGNIWLGLLLLIIGGALIVQHLPLLLPDWLFSWKTLLITIGIFVGLRGVANGISVVAVVVLPGVAGWEGNCEFDRAEGGVAIRVRLQS